jgi:SlyX protein
MTDLEEKLAHLIRAVDDLSDVIARQDREIDWLRARVQMLLEREAARQEEGEGSVTIGNTPPPHY